MTILEERYAGLVKFCDKSSVETVLEKKPVMYGKTEMNVEPFKELMMGTETISQVDIKVINTAFRDDILRNYYDCLVAPLSGPLRISSKVKDWFLSC